MLKLDPSTKTLVAVPSTTLTQSNILERAHLQESIVHSWDAFVRELGYEELFLVGTELTPHDSCQDRIDILALNGDGTPVVFELKRHRDPRQLLQAISYAAMVAKWDASRFLKAVDGRDDADDLRSILQSETLELQAPEIVLIAESFSPEAILGAEWLAGFGVPISAFAISAVEHRGDTLVSIQQRFPLAGVDDVYVGRSKRTAPPMDAGSWEDVVKSVSFPFAKRAVDIFRRKIEGSPHRRAFYSIYAGSPLGRLSIAFRKDYLRVYTSDQSADAEKALRSGLEPIIAVTSWGSESTKNSGFTFTISTEEQFNRFLKAVGDSGT